MKEVKLSWAELKATIAKKNLTWQYVEWSDKYKPFAIDTGVSYYSFIYKSPITVGGLDTAQEQLNQDDFEDNIQPIANYAIGGRPYAFSTPDFQFNGDGILATVTKNTTTNVDFQVPGTAGTFKYINGAIVMTKDAEFGDHASAVIIDKDNILGYGADTVLATYVTKWYINPGQEFNIETPYAGKLLAGLYVRVAYTSVGTTTDPKIAINYRLHDPL